MIIKKPYVLESIDKTNKNVWVFRFAPQDGATKVDFVPGMFAMLYYKDPKTGEEIGRAFSIASIPQSDRFEFMIAMVHGQMTSKLEVANVGDVYALSAPYGQFKFDANSGDKYLFIAGGTGVAPFFSINRYAKAIGKKMDACMIYSVKYPFDIIKKDELDQMAAEGLKLTITVTRPAPGDGWTGATGHIDGDMIKKCAPDFMERDIYLCGPPAFVAALKQVVACLGVNEKAIKAEMWG
jgi:glycine betaine catabolism B